MQELRVQFGLMIAAILLVHGRCVRLRPEVVGVGFQAVEENSVYAVQQSELVELLRVVNRPYCFGNTWEWEWLKNAACPPLTVQVLDPIAPLQSGAERKISFEDWRQMTDTIRILLWDDVPEIGDSVLHLVPGFPRAVVLGTVGDDSIRYQLAGEVIVQNRDLFVKTFFKIGRRYTTEATSVIPVVSNPSRYLDIFQAWMETLPAPNRQNEVQKVASERLSSLKQKLTATTGHTFAASFYDIYGPMQLAVLVDDGADAGQDGNSSEPLSVAIWWTKGEEKEVNLDLLLAKPGDQTRGAGELLVRGLEKHWKQMGMTKVWVEPAGGLDGKLFDYYKGLGFRLENSFEEGDVLMAKTLKAQ